ncbi:DUF6768 family protein [Pseudidiomarina halophila]|uniref:DUF4282 domain-containing protein n=1 Tax=Pseudidiomarina halophila TaxID=1449799 RepID=A0A432Y1E3_9GAMM|nr:DUF6768 family protein [Pseudidiomarina halophila]RUO54768.1 hypothetical protein CWI69_05020 [Pseudidiomarina halophila]
MATDDTGLTGYLKAGFTSSFSWVMKVAYLLAIVLTVFIFWTGYEFFTASADEQVYWGILLLLVFNAQVATKIWIFLETGRNHTANEIRRMEVRLAQRMQENT